MTGPEFVLPSDLYVQVVFFGVARIQVLSRIQVPRSAQIQGGEKALFKSIKVFGNQFGWTFLATLGS